MARPSLRRRIDALIAEMEPEVQKAFAESISSITSSIVLRQVVEALERRDVEAAVSALFVSEAAFRPLQRALQLAYDRGGETTLAAMPTLRDRSGSVVVVRFDMDNPRATNWLRTVAGRQITRLTQDALEAARNVIADGYSLGRGPQSIAYDLAGRISRATGRRTGGLIGLSSPQVDAVVAMRRRLLSGDPEQMREVLGMGLRDKRFDGTIRKYIDLGRPVPADMVDRMVGRYADTALLKRGQVIARTETGQAVHASKHEAFRQGLDGTGYPEQAVTRTWRSAHDSKVRHTHAGMNGQTVRGLSEPFVSPSGARMMHPLDTSLGAGASEVVACRCDEEINIDFSYGLS